MTLIKPPVVYLDDFLESTVADRILVANQNPPDGKLHVPVAGLVGFEVLDLGTGAEIPSTVQVWMNGDLVYSTIGGFEPGYAGSTLTKLQTPGSAVLDRWVFLITHSTWWTSEEDVTMLVYAQSTGGYDVTDSWTFTAADIEKPEVDSIEPMSPRRVRVTFNEDVDPDTVIVGNFTLHSDDPPYYLPAFTIEAVDGASYDLVFEQELSNAKDYLLDVENIEDLGVPPNTIDPVTVPFTSMAYPWPERRVWDLWRWIPRRIRWADRLTGSSPGHTEYFIACLQEIADLLLFDIDEDANIYDFDRAPEGAIDLLLYYLYNPFKFVMTELQKRKLLRVLPEIHQSKQAPGLKDVIFFFLSIDVEILPLTAASKWWRLAGATMDLAFSARYGKLGVSTYLGPAPGTAAPYTFKVVSPVALTTDERTKMIQIIELMKNSHEHYLLEEPAAPPADYWLLGKVGRGELGKTTLIGT